MAALRIIAILLIAVVIVVMAVMQNAGSGGSSETATVTIAGETFTLDIAADTESIARGLMGVTHIEPDGGMIFVFAQNRFPRFWMKNCLMDIDLLYLDSQTKVVGMHRMTKEPPRADNESEAAYEERLPRYESDVAVRFAIELRAGSLDRLGITIGDRVEFDHRRLKLLAR
ncbi:MAG: DUF192 domain-containing protein [Phycisphaerales bacterium]